MANIGWTHLTAGDKKQILAGIREGIAHGGPYHVEVHPADRCNITCFFCSTATLRGTDELPISRWEELLAELKAAGTRSIRLSGGGEPLFHREIKRFLGAVKDSGIPIENITTNAVLLNREVALLLAEVCDEVTVSLNTSDPDTYSSMMKTVPRNFQRVIDNIRELARVRDGGGKRRPRINLQFLVWKGNYRLIPAMYRLSRDLRCDTVFFNGLSFLTPADKMNAAETSEMLALYEDVLRIDAHRTITSIESYEQPITEEIRAIVEKLSRERGDVSAFLRVYNFFRRGEFSIGEKLAHRKRLRARAAAIRVQELSSSCLIGWHSLVIRTNGDVAPCCILQGKKLGNVYTNSLNEVWHGEAYRSFRAELTQIMSRGASWKSNETDKIVESICGKSSGAGCPIATFYYQPDSEFTDELSDVIATLQPVVPS